MTFEEYKKEMWAPKTITLKRQQMENLAQTIRKEKYRLWNCGTPLSGYEKVLALYNELLLQVEDCCSKPVTYLEL